MDFAAHMKRLGYVLIEQAPGLRVWAKPGAKPAELTPKPRQLPLLEG